MSIATAATIAAALASIPKDHYVVGEPSRTGNFQVSVNNKFFGADDFGKIKALTSIYEALKAAGLPVNEKQVKLTSRNGKGEFVSWPCVWVGEDSRTSTDVSGALAKQKLELMENAVAAGFDSKQLQALFGKKADPTPETPETPVTPDSTGTVDDIPV